MKLLATITLLPAAVYASFPGSTFGLVYNTTSTLIPATGHLSTFVAFVSPDYFTKVTTTTPDLGAFFTTSGSGGILHNSCNINSIAALVPPTTAIKGLKYALQWSGGSVADFPEGSIVEGFQLGPSPTFDTLINNKAGPGSWRTVELGDSGVFAVGWSDEDIGIPITLVKTGTDFIDC